MKEKSENITAETPKTGEQQKSGNISDRQPAASAQQKSSSITAKLPAAIALLIIVVLWELACVTGAIPSYMLPSPVSVIKAFITDFPNLCYHA